MPPTGRRRPRSLPLLLLAAVAWAGAGACAEEGEPGPRGGPEARETPTGADASGETGPVSLVDAEGRAVTLPAPPSRIVSLVPAATRVLLELGAGGRLVGRTEFDTLAAVAELPSVGGGLHPSAEVLVGLEPDLVIRFAGETDRETPVRLDQAGIAHLAVAPESVADTREMILELGGVVGRVAVAADLVATIDRELAAVRERVANRRTVRVAWVMSGSPPWVSGPGTFIDELIGLAGGENVFGDLDRPWAAVSPEAVVGRKPDLLLTAEGNRLDPRITGDVPVRVVSAAVQLPGPDLPRAAREIARALHPEVFR